MFTDNCGRVLTKYWFSSAYCPFIDYTQYTENDSKTQVSEQRSLQGSRVAGRIRRGRWTTLTHTVQSPRSLSKFVVLGSEGSN